MKKRFKVRSLILAAILLFGFSYSLTYLISKHYDYLAAVIAGALVDITNAARLTYNLEPFEINPRLTEAAQRKADDMARRSYFAHNTPEGKTPWAWFTESGYTFVYAGENLAVNFEDSEDVVEAWLASEGHRANILNDKFTEIGIAISEGVYNGKKAVYVVQLFGQPLIWKFATSSNQ